MTAVARREALDEHVTADWVSFIAGVVQAPNVMRDRGMNQWARHAYKFMCLNVLLNGSKDDCPNSAEAEPCNEDVVLRR